MHMQYLFERAPFPHITKVQLELIWQLFWTVCLTALHFIVDKD